MNINTYGPKRVCDNFIPLLDPKAGLMASKWATWQEGRVVNTASASGPNYNAGAGGKERQMLTSFDAWLLGAGSSPKHVLAVVIELLQVLKGHKDGQKRCAKTWLPVHVCGVSCSPRLSEYPLERVVEPLMFPDVV